jgi:hypothetical protein
MKAKFYTYEDIDHHQNYVERGMLAENPKELSQLLKKQGIKARYIKEKKSSQGLIIGLSLVLFVSLVWSFNALQQNPDRLEKKSINNQKDNPLKTESIAITETEQENTALDDPLDNPQYLVQQAKQGKAEKQYELAMLHMEGRVYPKNSNKVNQWFLKAAEQGHTESRLQLALFYKAQGNMQKMLYWLELAANDGDGNAEAQWRLGHYHSQSKEVEDRKYAHSLLKRAASSGYQKAKEELLFFELDENLRAYQATIAFAELEKFRQEGGDDAEYPAFQAQLKEKLKQSVHKKVQTLFQQGIENQSNKSYTVKVNSTQLPDDFPIELEQRLKRSSSSQEINQIANKYLTEKLRNGLPKN